MANNDQVLQFATDYYDWRFVQVASNVFLLAACRSDGRQGEQHAVHLVNIVTHRYETLHSTWDVGDNGKEECERIYQSLITAYAP